MRSVANYRVHASSEDAGPVEFQPVLAMERGGPISPNPLIFLMEVRHQSLEISCIVYLGSKREFVKNFVQAEVPVGSFEPVSVACFF